jgi:hypothetical protein
MRIVFRLVMLILQLPLWIIAFPAMKLGFMDGYCGDRLWLPAIGTFVMFCAVFIIVAWPFIAAWGAIRDYYNHHFS